MITAEFLHEQHIDLKKSGAEIARELGCTTSNICQHLKKFSILNLSNMYKIGKPSTSSTKFPKGHVPANKGLILGPSKHPKPPQPRQEAHWNWKGGNKDRRMSDPNYRDWRKAVFERDDYTCQFCGERGGNLNADHIKAWNTTPELRYDLDNGRTLCVPCHRTTDTYGYKSSSNYAGGVMKSVTLT